MDFEIKNKIICFCAKRNSGKSQLLRYLVNCSKDLFSNIVHIFRCSVGEASGRQCHSAGSGVSAGWHVAQA